MKGWDGQPKSLSFLLLGRTYLESAIVIEQAAESDPNRFRSLDPYYFCMGHALELILKAALLQFGVPETDLVDKYRHDLNRILGAVAERAESDLVDKLDEALRKAWVERVKDRLGSFEVHSLVELAESELTGMGFPTEAEIARSAPKTLEVICIMNDVGGKKPFRVRYVEFGQIQYPDPFALRFIASELADKFEPLCAQQLFDFRAAKQKENTHKTRSPE